MHYIQKIDAVFFLVNLRASVESGHGGEILRTEILYEDKDLLVVRKPAGLATQTSRVGQVDVVSELKNYIGAAGSSSPPYLGIVHRLDQPVEGLLVFAKNKKAAGELTGQFCGQGAESRLNKQYYAVLYGNPSQKEGELVNDMYKDKGGRAVIADSTAGVNGKGITLKRAVLHYRILQTVRIPSGEEISLADIQIATGRFHQIRAQMAHFGTALLGDEKYADEGTKACSHRLGIRNVALCARRLTFIHPVTGKKVCFETRPTSEVFALFDKIPAIDEEDS